MGNLKEICEAGGWESHGRAVVTELMWYECGKGEYWDQKGTKTDGDKETGRVESRGINQN